jgi:hypothetical protein
MVFASVGRKKELKGKLKERLTIAAGFNKVALF